MKTLNKLALANLDHYNNHPKAHMAYLAAYCTAAIVGMGFVIKKATADEDPLWRSGQYAK